MTKHEIFGIKFDTRNKEDTTRNYKIKKEYEITKKQLCEALKFDSEKISFIGYDYKKGILTIKEK